MFMLNTWHIYLFFWSLIYLFVATIIIKYIFTWIFAHYALFPLAVAYVKFKLLLAPWVIYVCTKKWILFIILAGVLYSCLPQNGDSEDFIDNLTN